MLSWGLSCRHGLVTLSGLLGLTILRLGCHDIERRRLHRQDMVGDALTLTVHHAPGVQPEEQGCLIGEAGHPDHRPSGGEQSRCQIGWLMRKGASRPEKVDRDVRLRSDAGGRVPAGDAREPPKFKVDHTDSAREATGVCEASFSSHGGVAAVKVNRSWGGRGGGGWRKKAGRGCQGKYRAT